MSQSKAKFKYNGQTVPSFMVCVPPRLTCVASYGCSGWADFQYSSVVPLQYLVHPKRMERQLHPSQYKQNRSGQGPLFFVCLSVVRSKVEKKCRDFERLHMLGAKRVWHHVGHANFRRVVHLAC
eukprot:scaffold4940_cov163-Amphora_coffeaeformis.AAC.6